MSSPRQGAHSCCIRRSARSAHQQLVPLARREVVQLALADSARGALVLVLASAGRRHSIEAVSELLAWGEVRRESAWDAHALSCPGVSPLSGVANLHREASKAADLDPFRAAERVHHRIENGVDDPLDVPARDVRCALRDAIDELT